MTTYFKQKFNWNARPFGSINRVYLMLRSLKETPPFWYRTSHPGISCCKTSRKSKPISSRGFFLFQRSWILVSKKPRPSQVVAMVTFMDTTRIQVQNFRMLASLLLGFCWEFKVVDPKRTESQSWVPVYDFFDFLHHSQRRNCRDLFEKLRSWRHGMPPNLLDFWSREETNHLFV